MAFSLWDLGTTNQSKGDKYHHYYTTLYLALMQRQASYFQSPPFSELHESLETLCYGGGLVSPISTTPK